MSVNLAVPFFSQRENSYIWKQKYETDQKMGWNTRAIGELKNEEVSIYLFNI